MSETLVLGGIQEQVIPPSAEVQAMALRHGVGGVGQTAVEQILRNDATSVFEWPAGDTGTRGVTYSAPTGDA